MIQAANVLAIEVLTELKEALCLFKHDGQDALGSVEMELRRAFDWLDGQLSYWKKEVRQRQEEVIQAKNDLARRKMESIAGRQPDCTEQQKALARAQQRLREAEDKVVACRRWQPALQRAVDEHIGPVRRLTAMLDGDWPRALALLDHKIAALDAYTSLAPPSAPVLPAATTGGAEPAASETAQPPAADAPPGTTEEEQRQP
jgi:hypothetical protein